MTTKLREVRCLTTVHYQPTGDDKADRAHWGNVCEAAYAAMRVALHPVTEMEGVTAIECQGTTVNGLTEWRTYWHDTQGEVSLYVRILGAPVPPTPTDVVDHMDLAMREVDMDEVVRHLRDTFKVTDAYVEQTGGGCATIYAGGIPGADPEDDRPRWRAVAGPGVYGWGRRPSRGDLGDFHIGPDGDADTICALEVGAQDEADVAKLIWLQVCKMAGPLTAADFARES